MERTTLEAACETLGNKCAIETTKLVNKLTHILDNVIVSANLYKVASVKMTCPDCASIDIARPGKSYGHDFNIYFRQDRETRKIVVQLNAGTFGSFNCNDTPEINYYIAIGAFAAALPEIQKKVDALDYAPYTKARREALDASNELRKFDESIKQAEHDKKVAKIDSKLVAGAKLRIGYGWKNEPIYDEIVKVTDKCVYRKNNFGSREKKEQVINWILSKKWELANNVA